MRASSNITIIRILYSISEQKKSVLQKYQEDTFLRDNKLLCFDMCTRVVVKVVYIVIIIFLPPITPPTLYPL
jgi:hypothetical protein